VWSGFTANVLSIFLHTAMFWTQHLPWSSLAAAGAALPAPPVKARTEKLQVLTAIVMQRPKMLSYLVKQGFAQNGA
jgi:hypothetical protein